MCIVEGTVSVFFKVLNTLYDIQLMSSWYAILPLPENINCVPNNNTDFWKLYLLFETKHK